MSLLDDAHLRELSRLVAAAPPVARGRADASSAVEAWWQLAIELGFDENAVAGIQVQERARLHMREPVRTQRRGPYGAEGAEGAEDEEDEESRVVGELNEACCFLMFRKWRDQLHTSLEYKCRCASARTLLIRVTTTRG